MPRRSRPHEGPNRRRQRLGSASFIAAARLDRRSRPYPPRSKCRGDVQPFEGVMRGDVVEQYAGGAAGRAAAIEAGAARDAHQIVDDAVHWAARLDRLFADLADDCWARPVRTVGGGEHPVALLPYRRWREVEVHLADLGLGFTSRDWSPELIDRMLPNLVTGLSARADSRELVAWLLGRGSPPQLQPWG